MRIAVWHNLPSGGGRRALADQIRGLAGAGHEVEVFSPPHIDDRALELPPGIPQHTVSLKLPHWPATRRDELRSMFNPLRAFQAVDDHCRLVADLIGDSFDVLFANSCVILGTPPIGRHSRIPAVLYLQEPYRRHYEYFTGAPWQAATEVGLSLSPRGMWHSLRDLATGQQTRLLIREERLSVQSYRQVLVNSIFSQESLRRAFGISSKVCYLGADSSLFTPGPPTRSPYVISVGQFSSHKRPDFVVQALGKLTRPVRLVWVANVVDEPILQDTIKEARTLRVPLDLRMEISDSELVALMQQATCAVYAPSLEPFGYAPIEAALCETPCVGVAQGGIRETVVDGVTGLLAADDARDFATKVETLLSNPELSHNLGVAARRRALELFSLESAYGRLEAELVDASQGVAS